MLTNRQEEITIDNAFKISHEFFLVAALNGDYSRYIRKLTFPRCPTHSFNFEFVFEIETSNITCFYSGFRLEVYISLLALPDKLPSRMKDVRRCAGSTRPDLWRLTGGPLFHPDV